jgi:hypothetical protein
MDLLKRYLRNLLVWLDEGGNALTLGDPAETISSRAAKAKNAGKRWGCVLCRFLNWFEQDHCEKSLLPHAGSNAVLPDDQP